MIFLKISTCCKPFYTESHFRKFSIMRINVFTLKVGDGTKQITYILQLKACMQIIAGPHVCI